jgi:hypothetical protein
MNIRGEVVGAGDYLIDPDFDNNGNLRSLTVRPIYSSRISDHTSDAILPGIARTLNHRVAMYLQQSRNPQFQNSYARARGTLQMADLEHGSKRAVESDVYVSQISGALLQRMWDRATDPQSNAELNIYDIEFVLFINSASIFRGGAGGGPCKYKGLYKETAKAYYVDRDGEKKKVNCAAISLEFLLFCEANPDTSHRAKKMRNQNFTNWLANAAYEKQLSLGWGDFVSADDIKAYLRLIPDHRIVVMFTTYASQKPYAYHIDGSYIYDEQNPKNKIFYLVYDPTNLHFLAVKSPLVLMRGERGSTRWLWCHECVTFYSPEKSCGCHLDDPVMYKSKKHCKDCGHNIYKKKHSCAFAECMYCSKYYKRGFEGHRCPLGSSKDNTTYLPFIGEPGADPKKSYAVWAYDFESSFVLKPDKLTMQFTLDDDYTFVEDINGPVYRVVTASEHVPNFVSWWNPFTGEDKKSSNIDDFIHDMMYSNDGRNICFAHNASGYDSRFIYDSVINKFTKDRPDLKVNTIMRGSKFLRLALSIGGNRQTIFMDSMLHLPGSLAKLGNDFFKGRTDISLKKGTFPFLANREEYVGYVGPIPPLDEFDLGFTLKNEKDKIEFFEYYDSWAGRVDWNMQKEFEEYCVNDTHMIGNVLLSYHQNCLGAVKTKMPYLGFSPLHFPTVAGYVHQMSLTWITYNMDLREEGMTDDEIAERAVKVAQESWCHLNPIEYYFARGALRGGRTEVRKHYHNGKLVNLDFQSQYPSVQMLKHIEVCGEKIELLFPVGPPSIEIFDRDYYPCDKHYMKPKDVCGCDYQEKRNRNTRMYKQSKIKMVSGDIDEYLDSFRNGDYVGILMIDATPPPDLFWPVLATFTATPDGQEKCIYSLKPLKGETVTTPELLLAVKLGYVVTKIYRCDR